MRRWIALGQRRATDVRPQNRLRQLFSANHLFFPAKNVRVRRGARSRQAEQPSVELSRLVLDRAD
jgi:hypothetical protein